jgi:hypothetical protein
MLKFNALKASLSFSVLLLLALSSCQKNNTSTPGNKVSVILSDGPGNYQQVNIDVLKVEVKEDLDGNHHQDDHFGDNDADSLNDHKKEDEFGRWIAVDSTEQTVDLLTLQNGVEQILGSSTVLNNVRKIRITLGTNNTVVDSNGVSHPLQLANPARNFLYVRIHDEDKDDDGGVNNQALRIDFDISRSIVERNGQYYLVPIIRPFSEKHFGAVKGTVLPIGIRAKVTLDDGNGFSKDAFAEHEGMFKVRGLKEGTYSVTYSANGFTSQTVTGIVVTKGKVTTLDPITLQ